MNESVNYTQIFCTRLKSVRLAKKLSQKQLGILAGMDEFVASTRINRYEKGVHQASIEVAQQLARALDVPLAYFYTEDETLAALLLRWHQLEDSNKAAVLALIN